MQVVQNIDYQTQIEEALKKAKCKKALYLYDESYNRQFIGIFGLKKASQIKKYLQGKNLGDRIAEFKIKTTEPDTDFKFR